MSDLILASTSPRRHALLKLMQAPFSILTVDTNEDFDPAGAPIDIVKELAQRKGKAVQEKFPLETSCKIILSADTIVVLENEILNKPKSDAHAFEMLSKLQGRTHRVMTGFSLRRDSKIVTEAETTAVTFSKMSPAEIRNYIDIAKPFDKAGSYGIQDDYGACFIERIDGDYYNVVGLPLSRLYKTLKQFSE
jgi:septum formation protein